MNSEKKFSFLHEFLVVLLVIIIVQCGARIWPIALALLLALLVHGTRKLLHREKPQHSPSPVQTSPAAKLPVPVTEQDLLALAFGLLQHRITERVTAAYPGAKWVWERPGARERFAANELLNIQLNQAGGYQTAVVQVHNLCFCGLQYLPQTVAMETEPEEEEKQEEPEPTDYGLLAFEWVEANLQHLKGRVDEAKAQAHIGFHIPAEELPHGDSWMDICQVLASNGFNHAEPVADGILIQLETDEKESK